MHKLSDFADKMNMSVDDLVKSGDTGMMANRTQAANNAAMRGQGLSGGVSNLNSERAVADASLKYQMGRQQMGLQATGALMGGLQQQYMNDEQKRQYEQGMNLQLQQAQAAANQQKYLQQQQQASGLMGMIGTGVGAYFGGAAGAQAGGQLGQSFGSQQYGQNNPYQPYQYQYPNGSSQSGSGGGGLGGGNRFGGAQ
jgi:hypothetical protein